MWWLNAVAQYCGQLATLHAPTKALTPNPERVRVKSHIAFELLLQAH